jgi:Alkylmercury lyase
MNDLELRRLTYGLIVQLGRVPRADELGLPREEVLAGWRRLDETHALVLDGDEIRMANPFSGAPTAYGVEAGGRSWYANCAWDSFGICAVLGGDGRITYDDITVEVRDGRPDDESLLFHCLVPAAHWWDDIVYT